MNADSGRRLSYQANLGCVLLEAVTIHTPSPFIMITHPKN